MRRIDTRLILHDFFVPEIKWRMKFSYEKVTEVKVTFGSTRSVNICMIGQSYEFNFANSHYFLPLCDTIANPQSPHPEYNRSTLLDSACAMCMHAIHFQKTTPAYFPR